MRYASKCFPLIRNELIDLQNLYTMKKQKTGTWLKKFIFVAVVILVIGVVIIVKVNQSFYWDCIRTTKTNLMFSRKSIRLFAEQNGRFPKSLVELNEYGKKYRDKIQLYCIPSESISKSSPDYSEHSVLDGTGGLFYNPETGELKANLTKPLKHYCRFYFGEKRNEIPSTW